MSMSEQFDTVEFATSTTSALNGDADFYSSFVVNVYFPFLQKAHRFFLVGWMAIVVIGIVYGTGFLGLTSSETVPPESTAAFDAWTAFHEYYPRYSSWPPLFIVEHSIEAKSNIIGNSSKRLSFDLHLLLDDQDSISFVSGYWDVIDVSALRAFAADKVSRDNRTMCTTIGFEESATLEDVNSVTQKLLQFAEEHNRRDETDAAVYCTGSLALFLEMSHDTEKNFIIIDAIVLPIAIGILGYCLSSLRHMIVALLNLICTILLAFSIMRPIAGIIKVNPFAPSIMMSLGIAICFDYTLFSLKAYRDERLINKKDAKMSIIGMLVRAGHVILLSGSTLFLTFAMLIAFPQAFLRSVGLTCAVVIVSAMLVNMTLTPSLMLVFSFFTYFPSSVSSSEEKRLRLQGMVPVPAGEAETNDDDGGGGSSSSSSSTSSSGNTPCGNDQTTTSTDVAITYETTYTQHESESFASQTIDNQKSTSLCSIWKWICDCCIITRSLNVAVTRKNCTAAAAAAAAGGSGDTGGAGFTSSHSTTDTLTMTAKKVINSDRAAVLSLFQEEGEHTLSAGSSSRKVERSVWFKLAAFSTTHPWAVLAVTAAFTAPLLYEYASMIPTADNELLYLQGSASLEGLHILQSSFAAGALDPYQIITIMDSSKTTTESVFTSKYFDAENALIQQLLVDNAPKFIDTLSITALSFYRGNSVSFEQALSFYNASSAVYDTPEAEGYRTSMLGRASSYGAVSLITVETTANPNTQAIVPFILNVRSLLQSACSSGGSSGSGATTSGGSVLHTCYIFGGYTLSYDVQTLVYRLVPLIIVGTVVVVVVVVGSSFKSVFLIVRLGITVIVSLAATYGMLTLTYQPGAFQDIFAHISPTLHSSSGIYWIIPIMSFTILVGLALDYDIFLVAQFIEYRKLGWSDSAAICLAIDKSGGIITCAGLIMAVSFAGLFFPKAIILNQYGFSLFMGVVVDTFLVRCLVMPAIVATCDKHRYSTFTAMDGTQPLRLCNIQNDSCSKRLSDVEYTWWPNKEMPCVLLSSAEEREALLADCMDPHLWLNGKERAVVVVPSSLPYDDAEEQGLAGVPASVAATWSGKGGDVRDDAAVTVAAAGGGSVDGSGPAGDSDASGDCGRVL